MRNAILTIMLTMWLTACGGGGPVDNNPDPGKPGKPGISMRVGRRFSSSLPLNATFLGLRLAAWG